MKKTEIILLVDDSSDTLEVLERQISGMGFQVLKAQNAGLALDILKTSVIDLVITDNKMPGYSGMELVQMIREHYPDTSVIMITGYASIMGAVDAIKSGADEYLAKPFTQSELLHAVEKVLLLHRQKVKARQEMPADFAGIIGDSTAIKNVYYLIRKAAQSNATILITGESGTGKELVARAIHYQSRNHLSPFLPVNCAAIPQDLMESEFFGYIKGAFTGAINNRKGFFQAAHNGSIFLDEISEMSLTMQAKLLRAIQEKEITMLGNSRPEKVNVRVIAATNKNLEHLVRKELFREDLFFRLNVINIKIPTLVERREDIPLLIRYFLRKYASELGRDIPRLSDRALQALMDYHYPGNVRELENFIHRALILAEEEVDITDFPDHLKYSIHQEGPWNITLEQLEHEHIQRVLGHCGGNKSLAAQVLGIDRKTLHRKLSEKG